MGHEPSSSLTIRRDRRSTRVVHSPGDLGNVVVTSQRQLARLATLVLNASSAATGSSPDCHLVTFHAILTSPISCRRARLYKEWVLISNLTSKFATRFRS